MAQRNLAAPLALALASLVLSACGIGPHGGYLLPGSPSSVIPPMGIQSVPAAEGPLPKPLASAVDLSGAVPSPPQPLPLLTTQEPVAPPHERGNSELERGTADGAQFELERALGLLLDPGADAPQPASFRVSPLLLPPPEVPGWQETAPQTPTEDADEPSAEEGDLLPPGPALITPEDVRDIERQPQEAAGAPEVDPRAFDVPIVLNHKVQTIIHHFSTRKYDVISRAFGRASRYLPRMREIFRERDLPQDLLNLAFIESAFNPHARSRARATGIWQFIEGTGRRFGMRSGFWVDQRRDPELSTRAAADYLKTLYGQFESWPLALAAYNAGERKIQQAIIRQKTADFWRLRLPKETQFFVPAFMAMTVIAKDPAKYGFTPPPEEAPETDTVPLNESVELRLLARAAQTTPEVLRDLNPTLVRGATPPGPFMLRLPGGSAEGFLDRLAQLPRPKRTPWGVEHRVRRGETWASIARRHRISTDALLELNGRSSMAPLKVGSTVLVPGRGRALAQASAAPASAERAPAAYVPYSVRRGDTLARIAKAHGVRLEDLIEWNGLTPRQRLKPGQILLVRAPRPATAPGTGVRSVAQAVGPADRNAGTSRQVWYTVKAGDSLWSIAQAHGVRLEELKRWNGLTGRRHLQPGQELQILLPEPS